MYDSNLTQYFCWNYSHFRTINISYHMYISLIVIHIGTFLKQLPFRTICRWVHYNDFVTYADWYIFISYLREHFPLKINKRLITYSLRIVTTCKTFEAETCNAFIYIWYKINTKHRLPSCLSMWYKMV